MSLSRAVGLVALVALASAAPVMAQMTRPQFGFAAGVVFPTGQFHSATRGEGFGKGLEGEAFASFKVRALPVGFRLDATYGGHGANDQLKSDLLGAIGVATDEPVTLLGANLDLTYSLLHSRTKPYVLGGAGMYHVTVAVKTGADNVSSSEDKFAWNLGGGFLWTLRRVSLLLEGRLVSVAAVAGLPRMTFVPVTFGIRFGGS